jgi:hypothetical protein
MTKISIYVFACCMLATGASAAGVDAAPITKNLEQVGNDPAKTKAYCDMSKKMEQIGDDDKKAEAAGDEIDGFFKVLGPDFQAAWDAGQEANETSAEGKAFDEAMTKLDAKCSG